MIRTVLSLIIAIIYLPLISQTNIDVDLAGQSHTNTDGVVVDNYSSIDISACSSISFSVDYSFSLPWQGSGNMESADECNVPPPECPGDPTTPSVGSCGICWDFMWMQFGIDGSEVDMELIGEAGTTDVEQNGTYQSGIFCTDGATTADITISNQNWAATETNSFSNVIIICYEGVPEITTNDPICGNQDLDLDGTAGDETVVTDWDWTNDGAGIIDDNTAQNTFSVGPEDNEEYTLTTTDINGCESSTAVQVSIGPNIDAAIGGGGILCANSCTDVDSDAFFIISGGSEPYTVNLNVNGFPIPAIGIDIDETIRVCHDEDAILPDVDFGLDPIEITIPSAFFPIDIQLLSVIDDSGCSATIDPSANSINLQLLDPPMISDPDPDTFCADENGLIDLTIMEEEITDGDNSLDVFWYYDENLEDEIGDPSNYEITEGTTVYAIVHDGDCPSEAIEIELEIFQYPIINVVSGIVDCAFPYELPDIDDFANTENTNNPLYYLDMNLTNGPFTPGSFIDPTGITSLFVWDTNGPCDVLVEVDFNVSIPPMILFPEGTLGGCGSIILPLPEFDGTVVTYEYNTEEDGSGFSFQNGAAINQTDNISTLYLIATGLGDCESVEEIEISLETLLEYEALVPPTVCGFLVLPQITPNTANVAYYTMSGASGDMYMPEDTIFGIAGSVLSQDLYIMDPDQDSDCAPEVMLNVVISDTPLLAVPNDTIICDYYIIDSLQGIMSNMASYASDTFINPMTAINIGDTIFNSQAVYLIDTIGNCTFLDSFELQIIENPNIGNNAMSALCTGYDLSTFNFMQLIGFPQEGGEWTHPFIPDFQLLDSTDVDLSLLTPGNYQFAYTIENACNIYSSVIDVEISEVPFAGTDNLVELCEGADNVNFMSLLSNPDLNGTWIQSSGPETINLIDTSNVSFTNATPGTYSFNYNLTAANLNFLCTDQIGTLEIILNDGPNAGQDNNTTACIDEIIEIADLISMNADPGGMYEPNGFLLSGTTWNTNGFATDQNYLIDYIVPSVNPTCPNDTATITILLTDNQSAGLANGLGQVCEGDAFDLASFIDNESPGGTFVYSSDFNTEVDPNWVADVTSQFSYFVDGTAGCEADTSTFSVLVNPLPDLSIALMDEIVCTTGQEDCTELFISSIEDVTYSIDITNQNTSEIINFDNFLSISFTLTLCLENTFGEISNGNDTLFLGPNTGIFEISPLSVTDNITSCTKDLSILPPLSVEFVQTYEEALTATICPGDFLTFDNVDYFSSDDVIYTDVNGCDSIIHIVIDNFILETGIVDGQYCEGDIVTVLGNDFSSDTITTLMVNGAGVNGCDSIVDVNLVFESVIEEEVIMTLCSDETLTIEGEVFDINTPNGMVDVAAGSVNGCDSTVSVQLSFYSAANNNLVMELCEGESISIGSDTYDDNNLSGTTILNNQSSNGCDSIINVEITMLANGENIINDQLCANEEIVINGTTYNIDNASGTQVLTELNYLGCDSIVMIDLVFENPSAEFVFNELCPDDNSTFINIDNIQSLNFPISIEINGIDHGTYNGTPINIPASAGLNVFELISGNCSFTEDVLVGIVDTSSISISTSTLSTNQFQLNIIADFNPTGIQWSGSNALDCIDCPNPTISINQNTSLLVEITHPSGCVFERRINLDYTDVIKYYLANTFNISDPSNNKFFISSNNSDVQIQEMLIYDRWGNLVFQDQNIPVNDSSRGWNGTKNDRFVEQGVYVYVINVINTFGENEIIVGDITLYR